MEAQILSTTYDQVFGVLIAKCGNLETRIQFNPKIDDTNFDELYENMYYERTEEEYVYNQSAGIIIVVRYGKVVITNTNQWNMTISCLPDEILPALSVFYDAKIALVDV